MLKETCKKCETESAGHNIVREASQDAILMKNAFVKKIPQIESLTNQGKDENKFCKSCLQMRQTGWIRAEVVFRLLLLILY